MKFTKFALFACSAGLASAQGLYNVSDLYALDEESNPLQYKLTLRVGYDDNTQPIGSDYASHDKKGSTYIAGELGVAFGHSDSNYNLMVTAAGGATYYLDDIDRSDDLIPNFRGTLNFSYDLNERIRFGSRNVLMYGLEPNYNSGLTNTRLSELYTNYSSSNDIGIRWSDRFGTVHGVRFTGRSYESRGSSTSTVFYNELRYRTSPRTVLTASYDYGINEHSKDHVYALGMQHALTERSSFSIEAGAKTVKKDNGNSGTSPYVHMSLNHQVNERLYVKGYAKYGINDFFTTAYVGNDSINSFAASEYDFRRDLRIGATASYAMSEDLSINGGLSLVHSKFEDYQSGAGGAITQDDVSALIYKIDLGFNYKMTNSLSLIGNYGFTVSSGDDDTRPYDYTRNNFSLGAQLTF